MLYEVITYLNGDPLSIRGIDAALEIAVCLHIDLAVFQKLDRVVLRLCGDILAVVIVERLHPLEVTKIASNSGWKSGVV